LLFNLLTFTFKKDPCNRRSSTVEFAAEEGTGVAVDAEEGTGVAVVAEEGTGVAVAAWGGAGVVGCSS
jgi:hypothetical protein